MEKYIHYCWFGGKPLPKLTKKCIKSWQKYLPDFKIIEWNETNVDLNECPFIKEAYENKKWAFVADYARTKAIYEYGGIYLDTDMMIVKQLDFLMDNTTFLGIEDSRMVNVAIWGEKNKHSEFAKEMLDYYQKLPGVNLDDIYSNSIPRIATNILEEKGLDPTSDDVQVLEDDIHIYPREYFYPLSYNFQNNVFTDNTCTIHYFDASWIDKKEQMETKMIRKFGKEKTAKILKTYRFGKKAVKKATKGVLYPVVLYRTYKRKINAKYLSNLEIAINDIRNVKKDYLVMHNPEWFGVTNATIELFDSRVRCGELLRKKDVEKIADEIIKSGVEQVVFSAMCIGWKDLAYRLKELNKDIKIKVFWHGSNSQVSEPYGWARNIEIFDMNKDGTIDVIATCKKSIIPFYEKIGIKTCFITNKVSLPKIKGTAPKNEVRIGIYAAKTDDWRKNLFTSIAAASLIDNAVIDMIPTTKEAKEVASMLHVKLEGEGTPLPRKALLKRMANNSVNLYVTFSECSPMVPLESFGVGVPCIFGNNHHYFENNELKDYLLVNNEASPEEVADKVKLTLKNKDKVMKLYKEWEEENNEESDKEVKAFLDM